MKLNNDERFSVIYRIECLHRFLSHNTLCSSGLHYDGLKPNTVHVLMNRMHSMTDSSRTGNLCHGCIPLSYIFKSLETCTQIKFYSFPNSHTFEDRQYRRQESIKSWLWHKTDAKWFHLLFSVCLRQSRPTWLITSYSGADCFTKERERAGEREKNIIVPPICPICCKIIISIFSFQLKCVMKPMVSDATGFMFLYKQGRKEKRQMCN